MNNGFIALCKVNRKQQECNHLIKKVLPKCNFFFTSMISNSASYHLENEKKCKQILQKAVECSAVPLELLETALQNLHLKKKQLLSDEEKENFAGNCSFLKYWLFVCCDCRLDRNP